MKSKVVVSAILAMSLATGGTAFAQGNRDRDDRDRSKGEPNYHANVRARQAHRDNDARREEHRDERGAGPGHDFYRGERLPVEYRHRQYVVDDWRGHNLSAPPRGYQWVQTGSDYVLIAIATGIIAQLLLGR